MKNLKFLLLLVIFFLLTPSTAVNAKDCVKKYQDEEGRDVVEYSWIGYIPEVLPDCDVVKFPLYNCGVRGALLNQFTSKEHNCVITLSNPDIKGFKFYEFEIRYDANDNRQGENIALTIMVEPIAGTMPDGSIANAKIFIYKSRHYSMVTLVLPDADSFGSIQADGQIMSISMRSKKRVADRGEDADKFRCDSVTINDYADGNWDDKKDRGTVFSSTAIWPTYGVLKCMSDYFDEYYASK